ncbi:M23/M56 family metallopeptidase [Fusibacter ferrireducens]|uniref:Peptidoglycan DD-metalloendopeptidase family protein n=1 Tax=Fusibacter ferrireducens TaxID=2785058 RepID=A0ABR9ZZL2_9FIRM|nr:M23/M56 family metallopeptidase [Fusibacter ferrireducens]MBF4695893.1 peptidoglycan DD-metalloendopeptidase family protein [Fusibacter ferrireducens]
MLQTLVNTIWIMSVVGAIVYTVTYLLRPITEKFFDSTWHLYMTCMILLVLLMPTSLVWNTSDIDLSGLRTYSEKIIFQIGEDHALESGMASLDVLSAPNTQNSVYKALLENLVACIKYIWVGGVLVFSAINLKRYRAFKRLVKSSRLVEEHLLQEVLNSCKREIGIRRHVEILEHKTLSTPILVGLLKPRIILPEGTMQKSELELVFSHECIHLKRSHLWIKALLICVSIIHWFNPLCMLLRKDVNRLCELACDEELVEKIGYGKRKKYAATIIGMLDRKMEMSGVVYSAFNENAKNLKERLSKILDYKKPKKGIQFLSLGVALSIALFIIPISSAVAYEGMSTIGKNALKENEVQIPVQETLISAQGEQTAEMADVAKQDSASTPLDESNSNITLSWPLPDHNIVTAPFGERQHPITKEAFVHSGIDIAAQRGTEILAAGSGEVVYSEWHDDFGYTIRIKHDDVYSTAYAHCSKLFVKSGDFVAMGQKIAEVGSTGKSTGPHLHFEVTQSGEVQDPLTYINAQD